MSRPADLIVGGWEINGFYTFQSGQPLTVTCPNSTSADFGCAANLSGQGRYAGTPHNYVQWLNPACVCTATGGHCRGAVQHRPAWRPAPAGTRTAFHQPGFVHPEKFQIHRKRRSAVPRRSLQHHQHAALRTAGESELHQLRCRHFLHSWQPNELQQHFGHEEQQPEQWRAHAAARAQADLLRHRASQTCLSTDQPASGAESRSGCGSFSSTAIRNGLPRRAIIAECFHGLHDLKNRTTKVAFMIRKYPIPNAKRGCLSVLRCSSSFPSLAVLRRSSAQTAAQVTRPNSHRRSLLEGTVRASQNQSYVKVPFTVPAGTERVTITFDYYRQRPAHGARSRPA